MFLVYQSHEAFQDSIATQAQQLIEKSLDLCCGEMYADLMGSFHAVLKWQKNVLCLYDKTSIQYCNYKCGSTQSC